MTDSAWHQDQRNGAHARHLHWILLAADLPDEIRAWPKNAYAAIAAILADPTDPRRTAVLGEITVPLRTWVTDLLSLHQRVRDEGYPRQAAELRGAAVTLNTSVIAGGMSDVADSVADALTALRHTRHQVLEPGIGRDTDHLRSDPRVATWRTLLTGVGAALVDQAVTGPVELPRGGSRRAAALAGQDTAPEAPTIPAAAGPYAPPRLAPNLSRSPAAAPPAQPPRL